MKIPFLHPWCPCIPLRVLCGIVCIFFPAHSLAVERAGNEQIQAHESGPLYQSGQSGQPGYTGTTGGIFVGRDPQTGDDVVRVRPERRIDGNQPQQAPVYPQIYPHSGGGHRPGHGNKPGNNHGNWWNGNGNWWNNQGSGKPYIYNPNRPGGSSPQFPGYAPNVKPPVRPR